MTLQATYAIPLPNAKKQGTQRAERRLCSLTAALACLARGDEVKLHGVVEGNVASELVRSFAQYNVPAERAVLWAKGVNATPAKLDCVTNIGGLELSDYQVNTIARLTVAGGIMGLDTGLGKTLTTCCALSGYAAQGYNERCYIVAPVNALGAWAPYRAWLAKLFKEVAVVSLDSLHHLEGLAAGPKGCLVVDELHLASVATTKRTKEAHTLRAKFDIGIGLTGTLLHGGVEKSLSCLDLAVPGASLFSSRWTAGEYFDCLVRKEVPGKGIVTDLGPPSEANFVRFASYLDRICTVVKKHSDIAVEAGIPEQTKHVVKLGEPWPSLQDSVVSTAQAYIAEHNEVPSLMQVLCDLRREGLTDKINWVESWLNTHDEQAVLAAWSTESLTAMQQRLTELGHSYVYVDGGVTGKARIEAVARFQAGDVRLYVGQIDASCVSVNLFAARYSVAVEHTNRAANYDQFLGRTCRRGQTRPCIHFDLVHNAVQQKVLDALQRGVNFDSKYAAWQEMKGLLGGKTNQAQRK